MTLTACTGALEQSGRFYDSADKAAAVPLKSAGIGKTQLLSTPRPYFLQIDDVIDVKFFYSPELNETLVVRPDGKITLQLIGDVVAVGRTTDGLVSELKRGFKGILKTPEIAVIVRQHAPQRVYVAGEVGHPGEVILQGDLTALQAIIKSGDFSQDAERGNVVVLRHNGNAPPDYFVLDFVTDSGDRDLSGTDMRCIADPMIAGCSRYIAAARPEDFVLQPFDVVFAPQTKVASAANFFTRYVNAIFPIYRNLGLSAFYQLNPVSRFVVE